MPSRHETNAILSALADAPSGLSVRARCANLARRVVAHLLAEEEHDDPLSAALARTRLAIEAEAAFRLANDPELDLAGVLYRERVARFLARGCRQLGPNEWRAETQAIRATLEDKLAEKFRRAAKKLGFSPDLPKRPCQRGRMDQTNWGR